MEQLLKVNDLRVSFFTYAGEVQAVRGSSWEVGHGETIAIVGESGCGKTVSIQTAMGLLQKPGKVLEGEVLFEGKIFWNTRKSRSGSFRATVWR